MNNQNALWQQNKLNEKEMSFLWEAISTSEETPNTKLNCVSFHHNVSKIIDDKANWFYETVLEANVNNMYYSHWENYYNVHVTKNTQPPSFELSRMWVNHQKQHDFNPPHYHFGGTGYSFVIFMKIPTHWKEQHKYVSTDTDTDSSDQTVWPTNIHGKELQINHNYKGCASDFQFLVGHPNGLVETINIPLSQEDEGTMYFFPAWLTHQVFPFYETEEERITISGNITLVDDENE